MTTQSSEQLAATIAALEAQRALLGDAVVDTALAPLREKLAALRAPEIAAAAQQLKQVSVLFVDVVGSTAMGQQLDPETIHEVMDSALERFTAAVQAEGGRVLQYTGDGMLAAFGTEAAGEDDVEAAVRAGLAIVEQAQVPCAAGAARARRARLQRARRRAHRARAARRRRRCRRQHPRRHGQRRRAHGAERAAGAAAHQPRQLAPCARAVRVRGTARHQRQGRRTADAQLPGRACRAAHPARRPARRRRRGHAHGRPRGRTAAAARRPAARRRRTRRARDHRRRRGRPGQEPAAGRVRAQHRPPGLLAAARPRAPAQCAAALRPAARHAVPPAADRRRRRPCRRARQAGPGAGAAVRRRRRSADAPAGPVDRPGLHGQPACRRAARRRSAASVRRPSRPARCTCAGWARPGPWWWWCWTTCTGPTPARWTSCASCCSATATCRC